MNFWLVEVLLPTRALLRYTIPRWGISHFLELVNLWLYIILSVWNVVPTLTSNERWDLPLDGPVLATNDTGFILVPAGAVRPAVVCSGHCITLHRATRRGGLQAWWERRPGLQVPEVLIEASANIVEKAESVWMIAVRRPCPLRRGDCPSFYRPKREQFCNTLKFHH
jgi:hypothetical protein